MINWAPKYHKTVKESLFEFVTLVDLLHSENGCPWDKEETIKSTINSLIGEVYELLDAVNAKDKENEKEELGDVLLNVLALLIIARNKEDMDLVSLINSEIKKIYSRHPHVFSEDATTKNNLTPDEVLKVWNDLKKKEGKTEDEDNFFSRLPKSLPPFERAAELHKKVRKVGFDFGDENGVFDKVDEELSEVKKARIEETKDDLEMECGDLIFASIALATRLGINPLFAIKRSNEKFEKRFNAVVKKAKENNVPLDAEHFSTLDAFWDEVKKEEPK